jgi:hypothetical protein
LLSHVRIDCTGAKLLMAVVKIRVLMEVAARGVKAVVLMRIK